MKITKNLGLVLFMMDIAGDIIAAWIWAVKWGSPGSNPEPSILRSRILGGKCCRWQNCMLDPGTNSPRVRLNVKNT